MYIKMAALRNHDTYNTTYSYRQAAAGRTFTSWYDFCDKFNGWWQPGVDTREYFGFRVSMRRGEAANHFRGRGRYVLS